MKCKVNVFFLISVIILYFLTFHFALVIIQVRCTSSNISVIRIILIIIKEELYLFDKNDNLS